MFKKIIVLFFALSLAYVPAIAKENDENLDIQTFYQKVVPIQDRIDKIAYQILNANKIEKKIAFSFNSKNNFIKGMPEVTKRQIVIYPDQLKYAATDDELAGFLAREISVAMKSFDGKFGGFVSAAQVKMAPKAYQRVADKRAVDFVVKAGYNPLGLITFITKSCPQRRQDVFSTSNLTSKRLMYIYERIYFEYPYFLVNNTYLDNRYYQNFLLNSVDNRQKLKDAIKEGKRGKVKYE